MITEDEMKKYIEFSRFIMSKAKWELSSADVMKLTALFANYENVRKKMEANSMEVKQVVDLKEGKATKATKGKK